MRAFSRWCVVWLALVNLGCSVLTVRAESGRHFDPVACDGWVPPMRNAGSGTVGTVGTVGAVTCGFVVVPETHAYAQPDGPMIRIAVVQYRAAHPANNNDAAPVFYLAGGPGGRGITSSGTAGVAAQFGTDRDYVTFDQRGVGRSEPNLECTGDATPSTPTGNDVEAVEARRRAFLFACRDRLVRMGADLRAYNSTESAADIEDIRIALGYGAIDLLGISYGTRLALTMMRDYPASLHAVVIDSVSPLQEDSYTQYPVSLDRALRLLFDTCAADRLCAMRFPDLHGDFSAAVAQLNDHPVSIRAYDSGTGKFSPITMTGDRLLSLVHDLLYSRRQIGRIPALLAQVHQGGNDLLTTLVEANDFGGLPNSTGMGYSVRCNEYLPFADRQRVLDTAQGLLPEVRDGFVPHLATMFDICAQWPTRPPDPRDHQPVTSDVPTLVMESANDPVTPPAFGQEAAQTLTHSLYIETPGIGHSVLGNGGDCGVRIALAFLAQPDTMPDASCTRRLGVTFSSTGA